MTRRTLRSLIVALVASSVLLFGAVAPASASTTRCATYGIGIRWMVKNGSMCTTVNNSGSYIDYVTMNFGTTLWGVNAVCNPRMKIDLYDQWGNWNTWRQGPSMSGCYRSAVNWMPTMYVRAMFPASYGGTVRVSLLDGNGATIATTVHPLN